MKELKELERKINKLSQVYFLNRLYISAIMKKMEFHEHLDEIRPVSDFDPDEVR